jgi:hypothetical protein
MKTPSKVKTIRKVTFLENYPKKGAVRYAKDSVHYMNVQVADKLVSRKVKVKVDEYSYSAAVSKLQQKAQEAK